MVLEKKREGDTTGKPKPSKEIILAELEALLQKNKFLTGYYRSKADKELNKSKKKNIGQRCTQRFENFIRVSALEKI